MLLVASGLIYAAPLAQFQTFSHQQRLFPLMGNEDTPKRVHQFGKWKCYFQYMPSNCLFPGNSFMNYIALYVPLCPAAATLVVIHYFAFLQRMNNGVGGCTFWYKLFHCSDPRTPLRVLLPFQLSALRNVWSKKHISVRLVCIVLSNLYGLMHGSVGN